SIALFSALETSDSQATRHRQAGLCPCRCRPVAVSSRSTWPPLLFTDAPSSTKCFLSRLGWPTEITDLHYTCGSPPSAPPGIEQRRFLGGTALPRGFSYDPFAVPTCAMSVSCDFPGPDPSRATYSSYAYPDDTYAYEDGAAYELPVEDYVYDGYLEPSTSSYMHDSIVTTSTASFRTPPPATYRPNYATPAWSASPPSAQYASRHAGLQAPEPQYATYTCRSPLLDADVDFDQYSRSHGSAYASLTSSTSSAYPSQASSGRRSHGGTTYATYTIPAPPPRGIRASTFTCTMCGWIAATGEQYDLHLKAHDGDCLFQCFIGGCEAAYGTAQELHQHSRWHEQRALGSKRSWYSEADAGGYEDAVMIDGQGYLSTPQRNKRMCVEPVTPVTPSVGFAKGLQQRPVTASAMPYQSSSGMNDSPMFTFQPEQPPFNRAVSYDCGPRKKASQSSLSGRATYEVVHPLPKQSSTSSSSRVLPTFTLPASPATSHTSSYATYPPSIDSTYSTPRTRATHFPRQQRLASPLQIPSSAPVDQGRFQPYPDVESSSMGISYSLPHPPTQGRTIHSRRREKPMSTYAQEQVVDEGYATNRVPQVLQSPVSPAVPLYGNGPALVPIPGTPTSTGQAHSAHSSRAPSPAASRRSSGASSGYTSAQAALVSAASMNRLLSRMTAPPSTPPPPPQQPSAGSNYESSSVAKPAHPSRPSTPDAATSTVADKPKEPKHLVSAIHPRYRQTSPPTPSDSPDKPRRLHKCEFEGCGKEFKRLEHVKRHERTHTLEKPFMCDFPGCNRFFSRNDNLAQHRKTHAKNGKTTRLLHARIAAEELKRSLPVPLQPLLAPDSVSRRLDALVNNTASVYHKSITATKRRSYFPHPLALLSYDARPGAKKRSSQSCLRKGRQHLADFARRPLRLLHFIARSLVVQEAVGWARTASYTPTDTRAMLLPSLAALAAGAALFSRPALASPASSTRSCTVTWPIGSKVDVNWLGPPPGNVSVSLASNIGGPTYVIAPNVPATSQEGYCDAGYGLGVVAPGHECGRVEFVVPDGWKQMTNYTIVVQSLSDSSLAGYTDMINITAPNASSPSAIPSGTVASLVTIPAPTSTNVGASVAYTGKIPAPTAVTGAPSSSASSGSSSSRASSASGSSLRVMSLSSAGSSGGSSAGVAAQSASASGSRTSAASSPSQTGGAAGPLVKKTGAALAVVACTVAYFF
ncbi:Proteophosphoglycan ppg4, partial [Rhodotorula toruloides]